MSLELPGDLAALDLLPEAVVIVDADQTVVHRNARAATLLDLDDQVLGKRLADVVELVDETGATVTHCLVPTDPVSDRIAERTLHVVLDADRRRAVSVTGRVVGDGAVLTFRHAGRRERVDAARSDLVATVSHEVRSPLTGVKGFTRTLLDKWDRFSDEQKRHMLLTINADADRVTRLLTELLDASRIDAGRVQLHRQPVDVRPIVERVVEKLAHTEGATPDVTISIGDDVPRVHGDPDKVEQVVTNLVENAVRHAAGSPFEVAVHAVEGQVEIVVADEGPGIHPDQHRAIFGKFSRGRDSRRAGTGLGLFITRGLVEAHGGRVWVESALDEGATFHVVLPAVPPRGAR